ncbi:MAG: hypothetical protein FWD76_00180 [Firmicutes bacterium]|nr:hypothetical protein [Bacillota bacterium]
MGKKQQDNMQDGFFAMMAGQSYHEEHKTIERTITRTESLNKRGRTGYKQEPGYIPQAKYPYNPNKMPPPRQLQNRHPSQMPPPRQVGQGYSGWQNQEGQYGFGQKKSKSGAMLLAFILILIAVGAVVGVLFATGILGGDHSTATDTQSSRGFSMAVQVCGEHTQDWQEGMQGARHLQYDG